ncbi:MAG: hypothetical protein MUE66_05845 [Acidimicrobiia bacterium]|nr:hypothetical protein [Acidimicrobiia bacterium]
MRDQHVVIPKTRMWGTAPARLTTGMPPWSAAGLRRGAASRLTPRPSTPPPVRLEQVAAHQRLANRPKGRERLWLLAASGKK